MAISNPFTDLKTLTAWLRGEPGVDRQDAILALRNLINDGFAWWLSMGAHPPVRATPRLMGLPDPSNRVYVANHLEALCKAPGGAPLTEFPWLDIWKSLLDLAELLFEEWMKGKP